MRFPTLPARDWIAGKQRAGRIAPASRCALAVPPQSRPDSGATIDFARHAHTPAGLRTWALWRLADQTPAPGRQQAGAAARCGQGAADPRSGAPAGQVEKRAVGVPNRVRGDSPRVKRQTRRPTLIIARSSIDHSERDTVRSSPEAGFSARRPIRLRASRSGETSPEPWRRRGQPPARPAADPAFMTRRRPEVPLPQSVPAPECPVSASAQAPPARPAAGPASSAAVHGVWQPLYFCPCTRGWHSRSRHFSLLR